MFSVKGEVAVVTGGGRGLGRAMAEALGEAGARLVIASRKLEQVEETAEFFRSQGIEVLAAPLDVSSPNDVEALMNRVRKHFGRIDILINNSGASWGAPSLEMPLEAWRKVMEVNVQGTFLMSQYAARIMKDQGGGRIINMASIAGLAGSDPEVLDAAGYSASKGAIVAMTRDLARKWARWNIRVNAIAPGFFPTKMSAGVIQHHGDRLLQGTPLQRFGTMEDIKGIALLLASRASAYMTGAIVVVDGGASA
nr:SDR family oxidoreductase [Sulfobacillus harzensis]